jgi:hypothetical protein
MLTNSEHSQVKFYRMFSSCRRLKDVSLYPSVIVDAVKVFNLLSLSWGGFSLGSAPKSTNTNRGGNRKPELTSA